MCYDIEFDFLFFGFLEINTRSFLLLKKDFFFLLAPRLFPFLFPPLLPHSHYSPLSPPPLHFRFILSIILNSTLASSPPLSRQFPSFSLSLKLLLSPLFFPPLLPHSSPTYSILLLLPMPFLLSSTSSLLPLSLPLLPSSPSLLGPPPFPSFHLTYSSSTFTPPPLPFPPPHLLLL